MEKFNGLLHKIQCSVSSKNIDENKKTGRV